MRRIAIRSNIHKNQRLKNRRTMGITIFLIIIGIICVHGNSLFLPLNNEIKNEVKENESNSVSPFLNSNLINPHSSSGDKIWNASWGGLDIEDGYSVWVDGTYIYTVGDTLSFGAGSYDLAIIKWDKDGNIIWNKTMGGSEYDDGYSIWGDGAYLYTVGCTTSLGESNGDFYVTKWDLNGSLIWSTSWGGMDFDYGYCISGDGTYIYAVGETSSSGAGNVDLALVKLDPYGNKIWNTTWGGTGADYGYSVWADGTYIFTTGITKSFGVGQNDLFIVKWDVNGNQIWNKTWGGTRNDYGYSIYGDGTDIYTTGSTNSFGFTYTALLLVKWDVNGNQIWNKTFYSGGGESANSIWSDGIYLYTSGSGSNGRLLCVKWSLDGQQILNITFGGTTHETYYGYSAWGDGTYIYVTGIYIHSPPWDADQFLAKFNVDTEPFVNSPQDITYSVGITGQNVSWIATDSYILNPQYVIYRNGVINKTGSWSNAVPITLNLDPYTPGTFNYTIYVFDGYGGVAQDEVIVTVTEEIVPPYPKNIIWSTTWGGLDMESGNSIWCDGTYLYTVGVTYSYGAGNGDLFLAKWDENGNQIWNTTWGGTEYDYGFDIWGDGSYIYTFGSTYSYSTDESDFLIVKWSNEGNIIWNKTLDGSEYDDGYSIWGDGTYLYLIGNSFSSITNNSDIFLAKLDKSGNQIWNTTWDGSELECAFSIWSDGVNLYSVGYTTNSSMSESDVLLVKWDTDGNIVWNTTWGGTGYDYGFSIWGDGSNIYTVGQTTNMTENDTDLLLLKWDKDGYIIWNKTLGGFDYDAGYCIWGDGEFLYTIGMMDSFSAGGNDLVLIKWDTNGNQIMNVTQGGESDDGYRGNSILGDGTFIYATGQFYNSTDQNYDALVAKFYLSNEIHISSPQDISYLVGTAGQNISWIVTDIETLSPQYLICIDGTIIKTGSWSSGIPITVNLDPDTPGIFNYSIYVFDGYGGITQDNVIVTVSTDLSISPLPDTSFIEHQPKNILSWNLTDSVPLISPTYTIYQNDTLIAGGSWITNSPISLNMQNFDVGVYKITIFVYDGYGGSVSDEVIATITKEIITDNSISVTGLSNYTYEFNSTNNNIYWIPTTTVAFSSYKYTIYRNSTAIASGSWRSGSPITINIDDLMGGTYNYTIVVTGDDIIAQNTTMVTVTGGPSAIGNGGIPGYNFPITISTIIGFTVFIALVVRKKVIRKKIRKI